MQINLLVLNLLVYLYQKQTLKHLEIMKTTFNKSARTYTIRVNGNKYRTLQMSKQEFDSAYYWTENDWKQFLKTDEYYTIK